MNDQQSSKNTLKKYTDFAQKRAARSYLETMATQLNHELQMLKEQPTLTSSMQNGGQKSDWKTLRQTKKKGQQLLELRETARN